MDKYVYNEPVQTSEMFYGRRQEIEGILKGFGEGNGSSYALVGGRKMGKTSMLLEIERQINALPVEQNTSPKLVPIYLDLVSVQPQKPGDFFQPIIAQLNAKFPDIQNLRMETDDEANGINKVFDDFTTQIKRVVDKMRDIRIVILADEVEFLLDHDWAHALTGKLRNLISIHELKQNVVITMTGVTNLYQELKEQKGSPLANVMDKIILNVFDEEEARKLIDEPTNGLLPPKLRDEIVRETGGHPFLIQYIMANLDESPTPEKLHRIIGSFPEKREDFRIWQDSFDPLERKILMYLIVKKAPVPHRELRRYFETDDIETLNIGDAIKELSYTGIVKETGKVYETNIPMFTEWYRDNFINEEALETDDSVRKTSPPVVTLNSEKLRGWISEAVSDIMRGPKLDNFQGYVLAHFTGEDGNALKHSKNGNPMVHVETPCQLHVTLLQTSGELEEEAENFEWINISDGEDAGEVNFSIELDSYTLTPKIKKIPLTISKGQKSSVTFTLKPETKGIHAIYAQVHQKNRLIQVVRTMLEVI